MRTIRPGEPVITQLSCTLYDSIEAVPSEQWEAVVNEAEDLAMDRRMLAVQHKALGDQCRMWFVIVSDEHRQVCGVACVCAFRVDGVISANPMLQRFAAIGRHVHPELLRFGVVFCGLPVPAGASHVRVRPEVDCTAVAMCLHRAMHELAETHRAGLLVFKEMGQDDAHWASALESIGYRGGDVPPMYCVRGRYSGLDSFVGMMRSRYRAQVARSRRKIAANAFNVTHHCGAGAIAEAFTQELHALYLAVWNRSKYRLECLPRTFFIDAARAVDDDSALTVIRRCSGAAVGFTFSIARGRRWHNLYSGVDYSINGEGDILFNLFYADLDLAFHRGCNDILLGQTSDKFKARLGAIAQPLRFFVQARSSIVHAGLRAMAPVVFPRAPAAPLARVFRDPDAGVARASPRTHEFVSGAAVSVAR